MKNRNITFSEYLQEISDALIEFFASENEEIFKKIENNEKLDELELYFLSTQLDLIERDCK